MAVSPIDLLLERSRQDAMEDSSFFKKFVYFFELRVPTRLSPSTDGQFYFPLALGPDQYSMSEPFTVEITPTQGGGLFVEENGIVMRTIRLGGHTGFKPRALGGKVSVTALSAKKPEKTSYGRRLKSVVLDSISGQRHFQYLQDSVFRTYGDLKRDPATADDTQLIFHNPKDGESWLVIPQNFEGSRTADQRVLYPYDIEMLAVDSATASTKDFSEDKSLLDTMKKPIQMAKSGLDLASGAVNDLTGIVSQATGFVKNLGTIMDGVTTILTATSNFVNGVTNFIEVPYTLLNSVSEAIDESMDLLFTLGEAKTDIQDMPFTVVQKFRQMADGLDLIGVHTASFTQPTAKELDAIKKSQELLLSISQARHDEAAASDPPQSYEEYDNLGTALTPGDVESAKSELGVGRTVYKYTGTTQITLGMGDTLASLSAKYLGDARLWQHIAVINGLKPPFLSEQANVDLSGDVSSFPGSLGIGNIILIPSFSKSPQDNPLLPVLGVRIDESPEVHLLGTDLAIEPVSGRPGNLMYDVPIDEAGGSLGPKLVRGIPCVKQGIQLRQRTARGTDTLYKQVGIGRIIGTNFTLTDVEAARLKFVEAIEQDSRISAVSRVDFQDSNADALVIDADVELRGFTETTNIQSVI